MSPNKHSTRASSTSSSPTEAQLAKKLSKSYKFWLSFIDQVTAAHPATKLEWKYNASDETWRYILRLKQRNLAYLTPGKDSFLVSLAMSEEALSAAEELGVPKSFVDLVRASPQYPEGRAARIEVVSAADLTTARKLTAAKAADL